VDSTGFVPQSQVSVATLVIETDEERKLQEEMEQLKQRMTELRNINAFEHTVTHFKYLNLIIVIIIIGCSVTAFLLLIRYVTL